MSITVATLYMPYRQSHVAGVGLGAIGLYRYVVAPTGVMALMSYRSLPKQPEE